MRCFLVLLCGLLQQPASLRAQTLDSPCPNYFRYRRQDDVLYGRMEIPAQHYGDQVLQIDVELSVGNSVQGYNGNIELAYSKEHTIQDILHNRPINYRVVFPAWQARPPQVTRILVNGKLICSGPKIPINEVQVLTTINLQHTLKLNSGTAPNNRFDSANQNNKRPPPANNNNNPVDFDPSVVQNTINFKPQQPKDPTVIYAGNPFISQFQTTTTAQRPNQLPNASDKPSAVGENPFLFTFNTPPTAIKPQPTVPVARPTTPQLTNVPNRDNNPDQPYGYICGKPVATNSLIVNGLDVPKGAYPWLAALFKVLSTGLTYICSATLISNKHVVTAAHCVIQDNRKLKPKDLLVILGKLNISKWVPSPEEKMIDPETIHVHPDYKPSSSDADIAVIELSEVLQFSIVIRPICLWEGSSELNLVVGQRGIVVGWGKNEDGVVNTAEPKQIALPIVDQATCLRSSHQFNYITSERTFCAGFRNGSGPCNGDSGSGFLIKRNDIWSLRGIVSLSIADTFRQCDLSHYVVFTDATKFTVWLKSFIL